MGLKIGKFLGRAGAGVLKAAKPVARLLTAPGGRMTFQQAASSGDGMPSIVNPSFGSGSATGSFLERLSPFGVSALESLQAKAKPKPRPPAPKGRMGGLAEKIEKGMELMERFGLFGGAGGFAVAGVREHCAMVRKMIFMNTGRHVRTRTIRMALKVMGPEATASQLGVSVADLVGLVLLCPRRKRPLVRRSDLRACRRVVTSMHRLNSLVGALRLGGTARRKSGRGRCPRCRRSPCICPT